VTTTRAGTIARIGGHLALDFANTAGWHASDERSEWFTSYEEWLAWLRAGKTVPASVLTALETEAERDPSRARRALSKVIDCRELVYRVFTAISQGRAPTPLDLETIHRAHLAALSAAKPNWERGKFTLGWSYDSSDLTAPLHPLMVAAAELLESPPPDRLRQCGNHPCGWLFIDQSKNGSRRWCSSAECGNQTRVREFRARRRSAG
jgi:predicted RNA-binding Zn ribbon-like protein